MSKKDHDRAFLQGVSARQAGKKRDRNPYADKPSMHVLRDAWLNGWLHQDATSRQTRAR